MADRRVLLENARKGMRISMRRCLAGILMAGKTGVAGKTCLAGKTGAAGIAVAVGYVIIAYVTRGCGVYISH